MRFISEETNSMAIATLLETSDRLKCAVAFIGQGAAARLLQTAGRSVDIICDLRSGCCNPDAVKALLSTSHVTLRTADNFHAKVYWSPVCAIVTSANLSSNGLGDDNSAAGLIEAGVEIKDPKALDQVEEWLDVLATRSQPITLKLIEEVRPLWEARQRAERRRLRMSGSVLKAMVADPSAFERVFLVVTWTDRSGPANRAMESARAELHEQAESYEDWDVLPERSQLIDFCAADRNAQGGGEFGGVWRSPSPRILRRVLEETHNINVVLPNPSPGKLGRSSTVVSRRTSQTPFGWWTLTRSERTLLSTNIGKIIRLADDTYSDGLCACVPMSKVCGEFRKAILGLSG